jgi:predicted RNA-binding protein YlxR (DUF448 family)
MEATSAEDDGRIDADPDEPEAVAGRRSPLRRCIVTAAVGPKGDMIRFVVGPDDSVVPDLDERLPGRGYWITARPDVLRLAMAKRHFARAARRPVRTPEDLVARIADGLAARWLRLFGLARRAGQVTAGYEQVRDALSGGKVALWVEATDGSSDGRAKLAGVARDVPLVFVFSARELADALGRAHVVHAAVEAGGFADRLARDVARVAEFRGLSAWGGGSGGVEQESGRTTR